MAHITTEADVAKPATAPAKPRIFIAFRFTKAPDGCYDYDTVYIAAATHEEAKAELLAYECGEITGDVYLQTDAAIAEAEAHGDARRVVPTNGSTGKCVDRPTEAEHHNWLAVMTFDRYDDEGQFCPADYARVS